MNQSKDHLGYVSTWFNSNMCEMQLFFSMAWLVLSYVSPKYGLERPKRRMRMLYSDGICMGYVILDSVLQRPLWLKMEQVWMTLKMGSKNFKMNFQQNAIVALMASRWPTRGGWAPKAYSIVGWPLKQKGSCWTVPYGLKHKVIPTLRQLKYSVGRTGYNFTLHLYNYQ